MWWHKEACSGHRGLCGLRWRPGRASPGRYASVRNCWLLLGRSWRLEAFPSWVQLQCAGCSWQAGCGCQLSELATGALNPTPAQVLSGRGRKEDKAKPSLPVAFFAFDCLYANGKPLLKAPMSERRAALCAAIVEKPGYILLAKAMTSRNIEELSVFLDDAACHNPQPYAPAARSPQPYALNLNRPTGSHLSCSERPACAAAVLRFLALPSRSAAARSPLCTS